MTRFASRVAIALGLLFIATACGGSADVDDVATAPVSSVERADTTGTETSDTAASEADASEAETSASQDQAEAGALGPSLDGDNSERDAYIAGRVTPVESALGLDFDTAFADQDARARTIEEFVQRCMADQGFEYEPVYEVPSSPGDRRHWAERAALSESEFTRLYGFGITTFFADDFQGDGVILVINRQLGPPAEVSRSAAEQQAYEMALTGNPLADDADDPADALDDALAIEPGSCRHEANQVGLPSATFDEFWQLLGDDYNQVWERVANDPRSIEHDDRWRACMATSGFDYARQQDIFDELGALRSALEDSYLSHPIVRDMLTQALEANISTATATERRQILDDIGALEGFAGIPELQAELDGLMDHERQVAAANWQCSDLRLLDEIWFDHEQAFVDEHGDQIALLRGN